MYVVTITERAPMREGLRDTNTRHVFCADLFEVGEVFENFELNWGVLVSATVTPFKE